MTGLEPLLAKWKSVQIALQFIGTARKAWKLVRPSAKATELGGPAELKDSFFSERIYLGHTVRLPGRLSQYCPTYFPVAYSPQAQIGDWSGRFWSTIYNPAPTATFTRAAAGATLAFLLDQDARETPRIVSPYHPDRTQSIPFHLADPGVPILVDAGDKQYFEELVEVQGTLVRIDDALATVISESDEEVVKLYYHTFFNADFFPQKGYILDARALSGGRVRPLRREESFRTSIAVEVEYSGTLLRDQLETIIQEQFTKVNPEGVGPARYRPAFYTPLGYAIIQFSIGDLIVHVAPDLGAINFATLIDTTNPDRDRVTTEFLPAARSFIERIRVEDAKAELTGLFASDPAFFKRVGVADPATRDSSA